MADRSVGRGLLATGRAFIHNVFVLPIREGRLRDIDWPVGLRPIVLLAIVAYSVGVLLVLTGELIRSNSTLFAQATSQVPQPRSTVWILLALIAFSLVLAQTGAIHVRAWVRWPITGYVCMCLLFLGFSQSVSTNGWLAVGTSVLASAALIVLVAVRGRRAFAWGEFVVVAAIVFFSVTMTVAVSGGQIAMGFDFTPLLLTSLMAMLSSVAAPATIASGAAVAELAVNSATWLALAIRDGLGRIALGVLIIGILAWRTVDLLPTVGDVMRDPLGEGGHILGAIGLIGVLSLAWWGLRRLRPTRPAATVPGLIESQLTSSLPIAAVLTPLLVLTPLIVVATVVTTVAPGPASQTAWSIYGAIGSGAAIATTRLLVGAVLIVLAIVFARRGIAALPELFVAIGLASAVGGASVVAGGSQLWSPDSVSFVATVICVGLIWWMIVRRTFTMARLSAIAVALLSAALFANPQWLTDPLGAVLPSATTAAILVGFTWALLSGYPIANRDSAGFPRASRVLLVLANTLFATAVVAYTALSRDPSGGFDLGLYAELGNVTFGVPLIASALLVAFVAFVRDRPVDEVPDRRVPAPEPVSEAPLGS
jgi:hypothetical protein